MATETEVPIFVTFTGISSPLNLELNFRKGQANYSGDMLTYYDPMVTIQNIIGTGRFEARSSISKTFDDFPTVCVCVYFYSIFV
jgi:hypothetical protein